MTDDFKDLEKEYLKTFPKKEQDIMDAVMHILSVAQSGGKPEFKTLEFLTHKLAGSSIQYGFSKLSATCRALEDRIYTGEIHNFTSDELIVYLNDWLQDFGTQMYEAREGMTTRKKVA